MPTPLISVGELLKSSWRAFTASWHTLVRYSAWLILPSVLALADLAIPADQEAFLTLSIFVQFLVTMAIALWVSVALYQVTFAMEKGESVSKQTTANAFTLILPMVWIGLLQGVATIGGLILLIIPGIYIGVRLGFSQLTLFAKNLRGRAALAASWDLTKNRFWPIFGRQLAGALVFGALVMLTTMASLLLVSLIAGVAKGGVLLSGTSKDAAIANVIELIQSIVQAAFIPLFIIFQVKLYRSLEGSR